MITIEDDLERVMALIKRHKDLESGEAASLRYIESQIRALVAAARNEALGNRYQEEGVGKPR